MMKNKPYCPWACVLILSLAIGLAEARAADKTVGTLKPGMAVHYYGDQPFWGGNWTSEFLPKVAPKNWVFSKYLHSRVESVVNHSFISRSWFSLRMNGHIKIPNLPATADAADGEVTFYLVIDHGARVFLDGKLVVDGWVPKLGGGREIKGSVTVTPGMHSIVVEGFVGVNSRLKDGLILKLLWQSDAYGMKKTVVPANALFHDDAQMVPKPGRKKTPKNTVKPKL